MCSRILAYFALILIMSFDFSVFSRGGAAECLDCETGSEQPSFGQADCSACTSGTYSSTLGQSLCLVCEAGRQQAMEGQSNCENCPFGKYKAEADNASCSDCGAGTYTSDATTLVVCASCDKGKYQVNTGASECHDRVAALVPASGPTAFEGFDFSVFDSTNAANNERKEKFLDSTGAANIGCVNSSDSNEIDGGYAEAASAADDSEDDAVPRRKSGRPQAPKGSKGDTKRNARRRVRAKERKVEEDLESKWRDAVTHKRDQEAETLQETLMDTRRGQQLFPAQTKRKKDVTHFMQLGENLKKHLNTGLGPKSKHRAPLALKITEGLPPKFSKDVLAYDPAYIRQAKHRSDESVVPSFMAEGRTELKGRSRYEKEFLDQVEAFFISRTHITSGANTKVRRLLMSKERLYVEFFAEYPELLRKASIADPSMVPNLEILPKNLTRMQKNLLAALDAGDKPGFLQSTEYLRRLNTELDRRLQQKVFEHLRKKGLVLPPVELFNCIV